MNNRYMFLPIVAAQLLVGPSLEVSAKELRVTVAVEPTIANEPKPGPKLHSQDLRLVELADGRWTYTLASSQKVIGTLTASIERVPSTYYSLPLEVSAPYNLDITLPLDLFAVQVTENRNTVREIYGTSLTSGMDSRTLFEFYQRTAFLSQSRLKEIENTGRNVYGHDVKIFFKFLEASRELGWQLNIKPSSLTRKVSTFLRASLSDKRGKLIIARAVGSIDNMKLLLSQIDFIQAEQLRKIWAKIESERRNADVQATCELYAAFRNTLFMDVDPVIRSQWDKEGSYNLSTLVVDALTLCITQIAERDIVQSGTLNPETTTRIVELVSPIEKAAVAELPSRPLRNAYTRQLDNLSRFRIVH